MAVTPESHECHREHLEQTQVGAGGTAQGEERPQPLTVPRQKHCPSKILSTQKVSMEKRQQMREKNYQWIFFTKNNKFFRQRRKV
jgi:hypothetical protein